MNDDGLPREPIAAELAGTTMKIFLCGDVMTGRGIDQVLAHPCDPRLHERHVRSATDYVRLAERANGPIPASVEPSYIWGAALGEFRRAAADARITCGPRVRRPDMRDCCARVSD